MPNETNQTVVTKETNAYATPTGSATQYVTSTQVRTDPNEFTVAKSRQVIWYIIGLINILILLRFILLLAGANNVGFVNFIYNLSGIFLAPFFGIFGSTNIVAGSYFEWISLFAIFMYILLGFLITGFISLFSKRAVE